MNNFRSDAARFLGIEGVPILLAFTAVTIGFALAVPSFADGDSVRYYLNDEVPIFIITAGLALVIIAGGIDLSVGAVLGLSAGTSLWASMHGFNPLVSILVGVGTGLVFGLINGLVIVKFRLSDFIVTLGTLNVAAGLLVVLTDHVQLVGTRDETFLGIAGSSVGGLTSALVLAVLVIVALHLVLVKTAIGRQIRASGMGSAPALVAGLDVGRLKIYAYLVSGGLAGFGGVLLAARLNSVQAGMAGGYELIAVAAAVLGGVSLAGGRGGIWQAVLGALLLVTLKQGFRLMGVDPLIFSIITGVCILLGVIVDRGARRFALTLRTPQPVQAPAGEVQPAISKGR
ncbi:ribose ABC transporter permease [Micromonospora tulbaghiae]|uniref:Ribose ABC transporter permease n=1 Tax=Micromonospora tulbaghiae TaxID=479978 RepID=A0A386WNS3_9ACTN|nr:ABC transporter permease [Micromonospora tulbaghiae]AYF30035.1 ribose ABC transporter permease [Micromonospora tulbaghiae]